MKKLNKTFNSTRQIRNRLRCRGPGTCQIVLSTPHGRLGTEETFIFLKHRLNLSTPHGRLGTWGLMRGLRWGLMPFNSTRQIRNNNKAHIIIFPHKTILSTPHGRLGTWSRRLDLSNREQHFQLHTVDQEQSKWLLTCKAK